MSIKKTLSILSCFFILALQTEAQCFDGKEDVYLIRTIDTFLQHRDRVVENRKTEITLLLLEADSLGKISNIHLMSDERRRDKTYAILTQLQPKDIQHHTFKNCSGKLIILPVVTISDRAIPISYPDKMRFNFSGINEDKNFVWVKTFYYRMPEYSEGHVEKGKGSYIKAMN